MKNKHLGITKTICQLGFRCGQQSSQPATTASGFDRKATRNPQLHIVPSVIAHFRTGTMKKILTFIICLLPLFNVLGQYRDIKKIVTNNLKPWIVDKLSEYEGCYRFGTDEKESAFYIIVTDSLIVAQNRYYNGNSLDSFKTFTNVKIVGDKFYSDQTNGEFVWYSESSGICAGLLIYKPWTKTYNSGGEFGSRYPDEELFMNGIYFRASIRILKKEDLSRYKLDQLRILRNEIYARYGLKFQGGGQMDKYFRSQKWYVAKNERVDQWLTEIEVKNIATISKIEKEKTKNGL